MAQVMMCDCGQRKILAEGEFVVMGISQKTYCKGDCEARVQDFLDARDVIHDDIQKTWKKKMQALLKKSDDFEMPDKWIAD